MQQQMVNTDKQYSIICSKGGTIGSVGNHNTTTMVSQKQTSKGGRGMEQGIYTETKTKKVYHELPEEPLEGGEDFLKAQDDLCAVFLEDLEEDGDNYMLPTTNFYYQLPLKLRRQSYDGHGRIEWRNKTPLTRQVNGYKYTFLFERGRLRVLKNKIAISPSSTVRDPRYDPDNNNNVWTTIPIVTTNDFNPWNTGGLNV
jgi:hypothetical protein